MNENENLIDNREDDEEGDIKDDDKEKKPEEESKDELSKDEQNEKQNLINILSRLNEDLNKKENEKKNIESIYEEYLNNDESMKRSIKSHIRNNFKDKAKYRYLLYFMIYIVLPIFTIVNLIGIFQIISVMNILYGTIINSIKCYLNIEDKSDKYSYEFYNFYSYYFKETFGEGIDFDLMMTMDFVGAALYNYFGFKFSSIIFLFVNCSSLFLILNFYDKFEFNKMDPEENRYNPFKLVYLGICYLLLFVGVGGSALFSQQILIDSYYKYKLFINEVHGKEGKEEKKSIKYFSLICLTSILGFFGKYAFDIKLSGEKHLFDSKYNYTDIFFNGTEIDNNSTYINEIDAKVFSHDRSLFYYVILIYILSIILSIVIYFLFGILIFEINESGKDKENEYSICQICGYTIYSEIIINDDNDNIDEDKDEGEKEKTVISVTNVVPKENNNINDLEEENQNLFGDSLKKKRPKAYIRLFKRIFIYIIENTKLLINSFKQCCDEIICGFFVSLCRCKINPKCCCCVCIQFSNINYEQQERFFCYCYQAKRKQKWFNILIRDDTQKKLMPIIMEYFLLQLTTLGFEELFNENNDNGNNQNLLIYILFFFISLILFFYLTISFGKIFIILAQKEEYKDLIEQISNEILNGTYGILIFNAFYSFIISIIYFASKDGITNNNYISIPIFMSKFYFFTFTHYCTIYTDEADGIELISCSTLISIYLSIWDSAIGFITDKIPIKGLFIIQMIPCTIIVLAVLFTLFIFMFCIGSFWIIFLYLITFFTSCGGLWFCDKFDQKKCFERCKCCKDTNDCCSSNECHNKCYNICPCLK